MDIHIIDKIPFEIDKSVLFNKLRIKDGSSHAGNLETMIQEAQEAASPKAGYTAAYIDDRGEDYLIISGIRFTSRVLRINLENVYRVFAYLITCGSELERWSSQFNDLLDQFFADTIKEMALRNAMKTLKSYIDAHYQPGKSSTMSPGSLEDWPIQEQLPLFRLLGPIPDRAGVYLTESLMMVPTKTVSGIRFSSEESFESCQLCPRERCPGRRALYESSLLHTKYQVEHQG